MGAQEPMNFKVRGEGARGWLWKRRQVRESKGYEARERPCQSPWNFYRVVTGPRLEWFRAFRRNAAFASLREEDEQCVLRGIARAFRARERLVTPFGFSSLGHWNAAFPLYRTAIKHPMQPAEKKLPSSFYALDLVCGRAELKRLLRVINGTAGHGR